MTAKRGQKCNAIHNTLFGPANKAIETTKVCLHCRDKNFEVQFTVVDHDVPITLSGDVVGRLYLIGWLVSVNSSQLYETARSSEAVFH